MEELCAELLANINEITEYHTKLNDHYPEQCDAIVDLTLPLVTHDGFILMLEVLHKIAYKLTEESGDKYSAHIHIYPEEEGGGDCLVLSTPYGGIFIE